MAKHTPGPWIWDEGFVWLWAGKKIVIDDGSNDGEYKPRLDVRNPEDYANACLIAAAPDLLAALEKIIADGIYLPDHIGDMAEAAIAKARGEG